MSWCPSHPASVTSPGELRPRRPIQPWQRIGSGVPDDDDDDRHTEVMSDPFTDLWDGTQERLLAEEEERKQEQEQDRMLRKAKKQKKDVEQKGDKAEEQEEHAPTDCESDSQS